MSRQHPYQALIDAIQTIEDFVINAKGGEMITFTVADAVDENNNLPVVDFEIISAKGEQVLADIDLETFEEAIIAVAKGLK